jgi:hypothetical protein
MKDLKAKTQRLKFERLLRQIAERHVLPISPEPCDCQHWLKQQAKKQAIHKPRVVETKPVELVLLASAAPKAQRNSDYNRRFEQGTAGWYHIPASSLADYSEAHIQSIAYVAIGITQAGVSERSAPYLYAVTSVSKVPRHMLTVEQSGSLVASEQLYWLFELSHSVLLAKPITHFTRPFVAKIAQAKDLLHTHSFTALVDVKDAIHG